MTQAPINLLFLPWVPEHFVYTLWKGSLSLPQPHGTSESKPTGLQIQMAWVLIFPVKDPPAGEPYVGLRTLIPILFFVNHPPGVLFFVRAVFSAPLNCKKWGYLFEYFLYFKIYSSFFPWSLMRFCIGTPSLPFPACLISFCWLVSFVFRQIKGLLESCLREFLRDARQIRNVTQWGWEMRRTK